MQHLLAGFDFHACGHYKEKVPAVSVDEICEHIPENCFKHKIVVHKSSNSYSRNLLNYLIHKNIYTIFMQFYVVF